MNKEQTDFTLFLKELMERRHYKPSRLAAELGISHATMSRWLYGLDIPNIRSCRILADFTGVPVDKILSIAGHLPRVAENAAKYWPEFREYARNKYPAELDEDLITMIEDLIARRRAKLYSSKNSKS